MDNCLNLSMFRAYDIRTPSELLTPGLAERLARAEARYFVETLGVRGVVLAHDARTAGPGYLSGAAEVFAKAGLEVQVLAGASSTSHFYFTAMRHPEFAGVMFGASHNPAGDTGQKLLAPGVRPIAEHIGPGGGLDCVKALYLEGAAAPVASGGKIVEIDNLREYIDYSSRLAGVEPGALSGTAILHDYLNGSGGREMIAAFETAGARLTPLHATPDGRFPLGDPNPVKPTVISEGLAALASGDFLLGTFFDGDADRIDFYAGDGRYLSSSFVYAAILPRILARFAGREVGVYADLKSNPLAVIEMAKAGAAVSVIRNGHSQIKDAMFADSRMIGTVEESAHFYEAFSLNGKGPYCTENTLYIALLVSRVWREEPGRIEELFALQDRTCREREWGHYFATDGDRNRALDAVRAHFESLGARAMRETNSGLELEATLMRRGLPFEIDRNTRLSPDWLQVCQRISQSENGLARWEVVAGSSEIAAEAKADVLRIAREHGGGEAHRG